MDKALEMGKTSATGSVQMLVGVAGSTVIMAIGSIILANLMSNADYGLYGKVLIPLTTINLFRDWGVNSAMTKYIAGLRVSHREEEIRDIVAAGVIFEFASGLILSFVSLFLAGVIASSILTSSSTIFLEIISVSIISSSLLVASQAGFVGFERMELNSFTLICQAVVKTLIGPVLVLLGYSVLGAVVGYTFSFVAAAVIGLATFYFVLFRPLRKRAKSGSSIIGALKKMLNYGLPLSVYSILTGILAQVYLFMVAPLTSNATYGSFQTAMNFGVLLTFVSVPISTVLFPAFAKLDPQNEDGLLRTVFSSSVKYSSILLVPATMALMALSGPIIGTLYGVKYVYGPFFLTLYVIANLFVVIGNLSSGGFLTGLGETRILMFQSLVTIVVGLPLGLLLIPLFGITGLLVSSVLAGIPGMVWVLHWIWKRYGARADFRSSAKICVASAVAAVVAYLPAVYLNAANWIRLVIGLFIFLAVYVLGAPLIGAVSTTDLSTLRTMFSGLGFISRILDVPLSAAEKAARMRLWKRE